VPVSAEPAPLAFPKQLYLPDLLMARPRVSSICSTVINPDLSIHKIELVIASIDLQTVIDELHNLVDSKIVSVLFCCNGLNQ